MRALLAFAGLLAAGLLAPAQGGEIFKRGPVTCTALSPAVTAMTLGKCKWRLDVKRRALEGNCKVTLTVDGQQVTFTASGEMARLGEDLPDNDVPLEAAYPGIMSCAVDSKRVMSVYNCKTEIEGMRKQCDVCVRLLGTHCYAASGAVTIDGELPPILKRGAAAHDAAD